MKSNLYSTYKNVTFFLIISKNVCACTHMYICIYQMTRQVMFGGGQSNKWHQLQTRPNLVRMIIKVGNCVFHQRTVNLSVMFRERSEITVVQNLHSKKCLVQCTKSSHGVYDSVFIDSKLNTPKYSFWTGSSSHFFTVITWYMIIGSCRLMYKTTSYDGGL